MGERTNGVLKRRGLLAGVAALVGAGLAKLAGPGRAEAAHNTNIGYDSQTVMHVNEANTTTGRTLVLADSGSPTFVGINGPTTNYLAPDGLQGITTKAAPYPVAGAGVKGVSIAPGGNGIGVIGAAAPATGIGVYGIAGNSSPGAAAPPGAGVFGFGPSFGARGESSNGTGVSGRSQSGPGMFGGSNSNIGVYADSVSNSAVFATSPSRGVWGRTTTGIGVFGQATGATQNTYGVYGAAPVPSWAGYFEGNVFVTGQVVTPGGAPSMAQAADGSQRTLYSQDSAEPVVEDFGEGKLVGGRAEVKLDVDFAAIADGGAYQVFLTEYGDSSGLFVETRTPAGFTVRAKVPTAASTGFGYRIVVRRKGAIGKRLEQIERPKGLDAKELEPPKLPDLPKVEPEKPTEPRPEPPRPGRQEAH